jgi:hypothetical protein
MTISQFIHGGGQIMKIFLCSKKIFPNESKSNLNKITAALLPFWTPPTALFRIMQQEKKKIFLQRKKEVNL